MKFQKVLMILSTGIFAATAMAQSKNYSGAELYTNETQMYGKYEARMMMATGSGLVSSMFLYHNDSYMGGAEPWVEVDIEILGKAPQKFQSNIITGSAEKKVTSEKIHSLPTAANAAYHTYGMEWTPDYVAWFIDGELVRKAKRDSSDSKGQVQALVRPQDLRFNLWSSEDAGWVGAWNDAILPVHQFINWVKVYKYTPCAGENGSDFTLSWTDNFDTFDASRWNCGEWTFDGNRVDLKQENATVKDGYMVLSLTKAGNEGFYGTVPVDTESSNTENPPVVNPPIVNPPVVNPPVDTTTAIRKSAVRSHGNSHPEYLKTYDLIGRSKGKRKK